MVVVNSCDCYYVGIENLYYFAKGIDENYDFQKKGKRFKKIKIEKQ